MLRLSDCLLDQHERFESVFRDQAELLVASGHKRLAFLKSKGSRNRTVDALTEPRERMNTP